MKSRIRLPGKKPRTHVIPIRWDDDEYTLVIEAAHKRGVTPSTYMAESVLAQVKLDSLEKPVNKPKRA